MSNNFLIEEKSYILINEYINKLINDNNFTNSYKLVYSLEDTSLDIILNNLDTYNLFSEKKIVIVNDFDKINNQEYKYINHLYKYLKNPNNDILLIFVTNKLNNTYKTTKEIKKIVNIVDIKININEFIKNNLDGYKINNNTIKLLIDYTSEDYDRIYNECKKLKLLKIDTKEILDDDIKKIVYKKEIVDNNTLFTFVKYLGSRNIKDALIYYNKILNNKTDAYSLLGLTASQFRLIYQIKSLYNKGNNIYNITKILNEKSDYKIKKNLELINYYTEKELLDILDKLHQIDLKAKTTDIDINYLFELFIIKLNI